MRDSFEATEVHWGVGFKGGSLTRRREEAAIRAGVAAGYWVETDAIPGIARAIESKCGESYSLDGDEEGVWLLLLGGSPAAPASTSIFSPDVAQLNGRTHEQLSHSTFSRCYLFCELTVLGRALYGWDRNSSWQQIFPAPSGSGSAQSWQVGYAFRFNTM